MTKVNEDAVEVWASGLFRDLGWSEVHGSEIAPGAESAERSSWSDVVLVGRLRTAVEVLNPGLPSAALDEALNQMLRVQAPALVEDNAAVHDLMVNGLRVEVTEDGVRRSRTVRVFDFDDPENNDWLAVRQFTVIEQTRGVEHERRLDLVCFVNGLPLAAGELKNPAYENASTKSAWQQFQTYKAQVPGLFRYNEVLFCSDGSAAVAGSLTAGWEHFAPWKTVDGTRESREGKPELEVLIRGMFDRTRFLGFMRDYVVFSDERAGLAKRIAKYHQYWAVEEAVKSTVRAVTTDDDQHRGRVGVVWHTQGSGKSLEMLFYAGKVARHPDMGNPTVVMLTDRNDLDDQLHDEVFLPSATRALLPEPPVQASTRQHLRGLLDRPAGGIVFTTIQKFAPGADDDQMPLLSDRRNVVVVADEAHRSQYDFLDGFARHMRDALPNASFLGFTGTPLDEDDKSTLAVFGDYIHVYDVTDAIEDGATVPIYYDSRLVRVQLPDDIAESIDDAAEEILEGVDSDEAERLKARIATAEAVVGAPDRVKKVAADIVEHWDLRKAQLKGKAMVVAMTRPVAVALYDEIVARRPDWHDEADDKGHIKLIMTGNASDPLEWQGHIRNKQRQSKIKDRAKNPDDPLELVIVVDMWLTGFDSPPMHTMYVDKPMKAHGLMQAIARVNRTWRDKPAGLIVDYIGITDNLRKAIAQYSKRDQDKVGIDIEQARLALESVHEVVCGLFHGHDWESGAASTDVGVWLAAVDDAVEFLLDGADDPTAEKDGLSRRFLDQSLALSKALALAASHPIARVLADDVKFFQTVRARLLKLTRSDPSGPGVSEQAETALEQLVAASIETDGVVDVFAEVGLTQPDLSIFSEKFLDEIKTMDGHENVRVALLQKLLNDEIRSARRSSVVRHRLFSDRLQTAINQYKTRALTAAQIIEELVQLALDLNQSKAASQQSGMSADEYAFYEAVAQNGAALVEMGDDKLKALAAELVARLKKSVTIDWDKRESVQAEIRAKVKRILSLRGYPPDYSDEAIELVLQQTELFAQEWAVTSPQPDSGT